MDRPPRNSLIEQVAAERAVEVRSGHDLSPVIGSGYVVAPGLVLTTSHLAGPHRVRTPEGAWTEAEPVWRGTEPFAALLLRVLTHDVEPARWGRVTRDGVKCVIAGARRTTVLAAGPGTVPLSLTAQPPPDVGVVAPGTGTAPPFLQAGPPPGATVTGIRSPALAADAPGAGVATAAAEAEPPDTVVASTGAMTEPPVAGVAAAGVRAEQPGAGIAVTDAEAAPPHTDVATAGTKPPSPPGAGAAAEGGLGEQPGAVGVAVAGAGTKSPGASLMGAALLAEPAGHLVGIVARTYEDGRMDVVPAETLLLDGAFRELVQAQAEDAAGPVVLLGDLLEPAGAEPPDDCPDWSLPAARHGVVPFTGRKGALATLRGWAVGPERLSAALVTGPGGSGKTRLAVELCKELAASGWDTGVLPAGSLPGLLSDPDLRFDAVRPTLLVLDFPEPSSTPAAELVRRLAGGHPKVRLLLLARTSAGPTPPSPAWWRRLDTVAGGRLKRLIRATVRLEDHPLTLPERAEHAAAALRAFAARAGAGDALDRIRPFPLDDPLFAVPLRVHLAALLRVRGHEAGPGHELVPRFLALERERWPAGVDAAVAVAMLTAPSPEELRALLTVVPGLDEQARAEVAEKVAALFVPPAGWRGWFGPEPSAEEPPPLGQVVGDVPDVVAVRLLAETDGLEALVTAVHDHPGRTAAHLARMLDVLRLGADHQPLRAALRSLVVNRLDRMLVEAGMGPGERLGDRLTAVLHLLRGEPEVAEAVAALPPWRADVPGVRALKVTLVEMEVERFRRGKKIDLATALTTSSAWLAAVGRLPEAVAAAGKAAGIFAAAPPYEHAEGHAAALFAQAACLLLSGVPGPAVRPAREAVARYAVLAEEDPRYGAHVERARYNLACALAGTGRLGEAVAAFEAAGGDVRLAEDLRAVLAALPEEPSYEEAPVLPDEGRPPGVLIGGIAVAVPTPLDELDEERLLGLGAGLAAGAVEAVRGMAATDPEVCRRLYRLGVRLDRQGRADAAVLVADEAVARLRGIAAEDPDLRGMLAAAAGLAARARAEQGDLESAVRDAGEAAGNLRALAVLEPGRHRAELAGTLRDLGEYLLLLRRCEAALEALREAVWVADGLGDGHGRLVGGCRRLLGICLLALGRHSDASAQFTAAAEALRYLNGEDDRLRHDVAQWMSRPAPDAPRPALSLEGVTVRGAESVARAEQALELALATHDPDDTVRADLAWAWAGAGRYRDALTLASSTSGSAEAAHGQAETARGRGEVARARTEAAWGRALLGLGRYEEALPHLTAAARTGENAAEVWLLTATALTALRRWDDAETAAEQAAHQARDPLHRAAALWLLAWARFAGGDHRKALEAADGAVNALPDEATVVGRLLAGTSLQVRGLCRMQLDDDERAGVDLVRGTTLIAGLLDEHGPLAPEPAAAHLLALLALGEAQRDPVPFLARALEVRPLPGEVPATLLDDLADHLDAGTAEPELLGPLTGFAAAFEREVPTGREHELLAECLERYASLTGEAAAQEAAVRLREGLAAHDPRHRSRLGTALAALAEIEHELARPALATLEKAVLAGTPDKAALARTLVRYGDALLKERRPVEALAHLERAADLCDELDEPAVAALVFAYLGAALATLDRTQAALEAIAWSAAERERATKLPETPRMPGVPRAHEAPGMPGATGATLRAKADEVRGLVLLRMGRRREALAHLVEAAGQYRQPPRTPATRLAAAEVAVVIVDELLADGRPEDAVEYAELAVEGFPAGRSKQALAKQRLVRCHLMRGALGEAAPLVEELIVDARRAPSDLTYRAVLADSLAQSAELLTMLQLDDGARAEARAREAIRLYDELIAAGVSVEGVHAGRAGANLSLAAALDRQGRHEEQVAPLREAVAALERQAPANPVLSGHLARAMLMLGDALMAAGRAPEASAVLARGTRVIGDRYLNAVAHFQLGLCETRLGRVEAAEAALGAAEARLREPAGLDGDDEELVEVLRQVLRARAELHRRAGRTDEAARVERDLAVLRRFRSR